VICFVTDRRRFGGDGTEALLARVRAAADAGVDLVQVRERDLEARDLLQLVERCLEAVRGTATRVVINDRFDVALAAGAHGVHLPANGAPAARLRSVAPSGFLIGRSVHDAGEAVAACGAGGLDYLICGTIFATDSKPGQAPAGIAALSAVARAVRVPVLAIGGITWASVPALAAAGASGFAGIGMFAGDTDALRGRVQQAAAAFDTLPPSQG
jgi:thiamine-phosphate pyrophosphorylase